MGKSKAHLIGWREWLALPELGIERIKAKIDTGARTSALHAFDITTESRGGREFAMFHVQPDQDDEGRIVRCEARVIDRRAVKNSGGQIEERPVIQTSLHLGDVDVPIELTLTPRHQMRFRMLLGRHAVRRRFLIDPGRSYLMSRRKDA